jgi:lysophospholipase L1-like esterase
MQRHSGAREWLIGLALALASILLPFAIGEGVLRLLAPAPDTRGLFADAPDSKLETRGVPHARGVYAGAPVELNRLGMRDREFTEPKPPNTLRIVVLGDSMTFGQGAPQDRVWPRVLETELARLLPANAGHVEVLNLAVPGYNTIQELATLRETGLALHPDVILLGFFYNDVELTPRELARLHPGAATPAADVRSPVNRAITALKEHSMVFAYLSPRIGAVMRRFGGKGYGQAASYNALYAPGAEGWTLTRDALLEMKGVAMQAGAGFAVVVLPAMVNCSPQTYPMQAYHDALREFTHAQGIESVDLLESLRSVDFSRMWVNPTDGHPDAQAHRLLGEAAARGLAPYLAAEAARRTRATSASNSPRSFWKIATK